MIQLTALVLICSTPIIKNHTNEWNNRDKQTLNRAKIVCGTEYNSCVKLFVKKEKLVYNVICKQQKRENK